VPIRACKLWHPRKPNLYDLQGTIGAVIGAVIGTKRRRERGLDLEQKLRH